MNRLIILNLQCFAGMKLKVTVEASFPDNIPIILIANHQSMYDIPIIMWYLRKLEPKFISKKELGKWIPSISFSLRNMGSLLIDRKDRSSSLKAIEIFGRDAADRAHTICLFPEGTRARDGIIKDFKGGGFALLRKTAPEALVIPIAIKGSWKLLKYNLLPIPYGVHVHMHVFPSLKVTDFRDDREMLKHIHKMISDYKSNGS
jgi:1-acyl-sn-glycerol-3-phosphate acyltransferase